MLHFFNGAHTSMINELPMLVMGYKKGTLARKKVIDNFLEYQGSTNPHLIANENDFRKVMAMANRKRLKDKENHQELKRSRLQNSKHG